MDIITRFKKYSKIDSIYDSGVSTYQVILVAIRLAVDVIKWFSAQEFATMSAVQTFGVTQTARRVHKIFYRRHFAAQTALV